MRVIWKDRAIGHLEQVVDYGLKTFGTRTASRFIERVHAYDKRLAANPYMGALEPLLAHRKVSLTHPLC